MDSDTESPVASDSDTALQTSSFYRIPPEVLQEVFINQERFICVEDKVASGGIDDEEACGPYCWQVVTHVCRMWRAAALGFPILWSRITLTSHPEWMAEILRRSGTLPLLVVSHILPALHDKQMDALEVVLGQLSRIQTLHLLATCTYSHPLGSISNMLSGSTLRSRTLSLYGPLVAKQAYEPVRPVYLPALLHPDRTPCLETLNLLGPHYGIVLRGPCASTLRHLNVKTVYQGSDSHWPNTTILLDVLSAAPLLETLLFKRQHAWPVFEEQTVPRTASLPYLHTLVLQMKNNEMCTVLQSLDLPALCCLMLSMTLSPRDIPVFISALQSKSDVLGPMHEISIKSLPSNSRGVTMVASDNLLNTEGLCGCRFDQFTTTPPIRTPFSQSPRA